MDLSQDIEQVRGIVHLRATLLKWADAPSILYLAAFPEVDSCDFEKILYKHRHGRKTGPINKKMSNLKMVFSMKKMQGTFFITNMMGNSVRLFTFLKTQWGRFFKFSHWLAHFYWNIPYYFLELTISFPQIYQSICFIK